MFNIDTRERIIIAALVLLLMLGIGVSAYRKACSGVNIRSAKIPGGASDAIFPDQDLSDGIRIDINTAGEADLEKIKGVGKVMARRIIEYRKENGLFISIDDIKKVKGIGPILFDKIKEKIAAE
jgi:competence protein ComEA